MVQILLPLDEDELVAGSDAGQDDDGCESEVIISLHVHDEILKIVSVFSVMILSWSQ